MTSETSGSQNGMKTWVDYKITRGIIKGVLSNTVGIVLTIKADPELETYMQALSKDRRMEVAAFGDMWYNCGSDEALEVYTIDEQLNSRIYSFTNVALPLLITQNNDGRLRLNTEPDEIVNLSFLKLVGIGKPEGITLGVAGAYSRQYVQSLQKKLPEATDAFLRDHLVPVTINLSIIQKI